MIAFDRVWWNFNPFLQSKIDVDPIYRVLMFLPCFGHVLCMTRFIQIHRMMECKLIAHPTWEVYWKKSLGITTLSCEVGSMRLRPEWPWRARRYKIAPDESVQYFYIFLFPPPLAMLFFHSSSDQWWQQEMFLKIVSDSPEFNCSIIFSM